jgi:CRISPR-associated protein Csb2
MVLGVRYLTGYAVATDISRQRAEWPPHPARIFMAMAAAHFETGGDLLERKALEWLEREPAPQFFASEAQHRSIVESYVPVNDHHGGVLRRQKQARGFPRVRPDEDSVYLFWDSEPEIPIRESIERLCAKVTRIGHSSSLAQMWISDAGTAREANWIPDEAKTSERLRVVERGFLEYLEKSFNSAAIEEYFQLTEELAQAKGKAKVSFKTMIKERFGDSIPQAARPLVASWNSYRCLTASTGTAKKLEVLGPFDPGFIVLSKGDGAALGLESTLQLTAALRNAAMKAAPNPPPEWLSGHASNGSPSVHPHAAFFPLPYIGSQHADGHVMGLGIAIPRELAGETGSREEALRTCLGPLFFDPKSGAPRELRLWKDKVWRWHLERETRERPPQTLRRATWMGPADRWGSVTPLVLHHYPKKGRVEDIERIVREGFRSALLPEPETIRLSSVSAHTGAGHAMSLPFFEEGGPGLSKYQTHVVATFRENVSGPMLVGRGRFRGYGLFRPLRREADDQ